MRRILLINPNTAQATTARMVALTAAAGDAEVIGATAVRGPAMILTAEELAAAANEVVAIGLARAGEVDAIIIGAFGDPGLAKLRAKVVVPVTGLAEASMLEAATAGRRFGVATTTPAMVDAIRERADQMGLAALYTGVRLTKGDAMALVADPPRLVEAMAAAVQAAIDCDGAEAVIIAGGPLGDAAVALAPRFTTPVIAPIPAAMRRLGQLGFSRLGLTNRA